jgi:hypothetical protein
MRNFKDIISEKLKISTKEPECVKTSVPKLNVDTLLQFTKLFIQKLGDKAKLPIDDIYDYLDIKLPENVSHNVRPSKGGKSFKRINYVDYLMGIECYEHERFGYIVTLFYGNNGRATVWQPMSDKSLTDFITLLGNDDEETGSIVFDNILKKIYYEANK